MRNLPGLIDALCDVYDDPTMTPAGGATFCNFAVQRIAKAMGCNDLAGMTADEMAVFMANSPDWEERSIGDVQALANQGSLIFAVATSQALDKSHGHICTIRPGNAILSGKWGMTPRCVNIGEENFIGRAKRGLLQGLPCGVNEAFQPMPLFYAWKPSLGGNDAVV